MRTTTTSTTTTTTTMEEEEEERHQKLSPETSANSMGATSSTGTTPTPAITPPAPATLLLTPPPPPTLMYARIILGEVTPLLAAIKRSGAPRWSSHSLGDVSEHLTASLERLQSRLLSLEPLEPPLPPLEFLEPFLSVIKAEDTSGPITRDALCSVDRMIGYGLLNPRDTSAGSLRESAAAAEAVAAAVSRARFIGTESASDEVVLFSIVHVLSALVLSSAGPLLSNGAVCEILNSAFRICFENRLSDLLRACTEEALRQMVTLIFTRLPFYPPHDPPSGPPAPPRPPKVKLRSPHPSAKFDLDATSPAAAAGVSDPDPECESDNSKDVLKSAGDDEVAGTGTEELGLDIQLGANEDDAATLLTDGGQQAAVVTGQKDAYINSQGVTFTAAASTSYAADPTLQPFGVPCLRELLRFLITLTTPLNAQNTTKMIETALHLLTVALEIGGYSLASFPGLMVLISDHLCKNLLQLLSYLETHRSYNVYITSLRLYILLCENFKTKLKYQLESFHNQLISLVTADRPAVTYTHKEYAIMAVLRLWSERNFTRELYLNFDCDLFAANCLEESVKSLSKQVFPLDGVYGNNLLCLDALLRLMEALDANGPSESRETADASKSANGTRGPDWARGSSYAAPKLMTRPRAMQHTHTDAHELLRRKKQKNIIAIATDLFNNKPEKGISYLLEHGVLGQRRMCPNARSERPRQGRVAARGQADAGDVSGGATQADAISGDKMSGQKGQSGSRKERSAYDAEEIAQFLRQNHKLCKKALGNYLSAKKNLDVLNAFVATFDFKNVRLDEALRNFLEAFRLPGEAPLISLVLETFAAHWFNANVDDDADRATPAEPQCAELVTRPPEPRSCQLDPQTEATSTESQCSEVGPEPETAALDARGSELGQTTPAEHQCSEIDPQTEAGSQGSQKMVQDADTTELHHIITMEGPAFTETRTVEPQHSERVSDASPQVSERQDSEPRRDETADASNRLAKQCSSSDGVAEGSSFDSSEMGSRLAGDVSSIPGLDVAVRGLGCAEVDPVGTILGPSSYDFLRGTNGPLGRDGTASIGTIPSDSDGRADGTVNAADGTANATGSSEGYHVERDGTGSAPDGTSNAIGSTEGYLTERDGTNDKGPGTNTTNQYPVESTSSNMALGTESGSLHVGGHLDTATETLEKPQDTPTVRQDPRSDEFSEFSSERGGTEGLKNVLEGCTTDRANGTKDVHIDRPDGTKDASTDRPDGMKDAPTDRPLGTTISRPEESQDTARFREDDTPPTRPDGTTSMKPLDAPTTRTDGVTVSRQQVEDIPTSSIKPQDAPTTRTDGVTVSRQQVEDIPTSSIKPQDAPTTRTDGVTVSRQQVEDIPTSNIKPQDAPISKTDGATASTPQPEDTPTSKRDAGSTNKPQMSTAAPSTKDVVSEAPKCGVRSSDAAFTLAYAIIMLNVDQHNKNAKKQNVPMTVEQFTANLRGVNDGAHFPREMLAQIYEAVKSEELVMPSEQQGAVKDEYLWKLLLKRGRSDDGVYVLARDFSQVDREIFLTAWGPTVAALSYVYDKSTSEDTVLTALGGYRKIASIAFRFNMADVFDNLIVTLCKFTTLNYPTAGDVEAIAANFTSSAKGRLAAKCVFDLAVQYGDAIREGWRNILEILVRLFQLRLLPDGLTQGYDFVAPESKVSLLPEQPTQQPIRSENSLLSSLYSYIAMGDAHSKTNAHSTESVSCARVCVRDCKIERLVHESVYLRTHTLIELTRTLLTNAYTDDVHTHARTHAHAFLLELCVRILTANKDRVHTIWPHVRKNVYTAFLCAQREPRVYLLERTCVCVLRCTQILLRKPTESWVLTIQWLLSISPNRMTKVAKQILLGLKEILTANTVHIQPEEWDLIFSLVEYAGAGALPPTFSTSHSAEEEGGESDGTVDSGVGSDDQPQPPLPDGRLNAPLPADSSGGWILVGREGEVEATQTTSTTTTTTGTTTTTTGTPYTLAPTTSPQLPHKPHNLLVAVVTLSFLAKECINAPNIKTTTTTTATTATILALGSATRATRMLVEAALHGGLVNHQLSERKTSYQRKKKKKKRKTATKTYHSEEEEEEESGSCGDGSDGNGTSVNANNNTQLIYQQVSEKLLDLMGCLHTSASQLSTYYQTTTATTTTTTATVDLWNIALCPLLQGIARFCCDSRGSVRSLALTTLQRALLTHDLVVLSASKWEQLFHRVLFPLLSGLIDLPSLALPHQQHQHQQLEEARLRAATLVMKVYLRHLSPLLTLPTFTALWLTILDFYEKYLSLSSDHLVEAIPELLKNMLLVMKTTQAFQTPQGLTQLWAITWDKIDSFLPSLRHNIFRSHPPSEIPSLEPKSERDEESGFVPPTLREQNAARLSLSQENLPEIIENSSVILQPPLPAPQLASPVSQSETSFPERGRSQPMTSQSAVPIILKGLPMFTDKN